jgi:hypothetical protein
MIVRDVTFPSSTEENCSQHVYQLPPEGPEEWLMVNICSINAASPFLSCLRKCKFLSSPNRIAHTKPEAIGYLPISQVRKCRRHKPQSFDNEIEGKKFRP